MDNGSRTIVGADVGKLWQPGRLWIIRATRAGKGE